MPRETDSSVSFHPVNRVGPEMQQNRPKKQAFYGTDFEGLTFSSEERD